MAGDNGDRGREVMSGLPRSRPQRRSAKRRPPSPGGGPDSPAVGDNLAGSGSSTPPARPPEQADKAATEGKAAGGGRARPTAGPPAGRRQAPPAKGRARPAKRATGRPAGAGAGRGARAKAKAKAQNAGPRAKAGAGAAQRTARAGAGGGAAAPKRPLVTGPQARRRTPAPPARAGTALRSPRPIEPPGGAEILGAAVGAAGELAQMGLKVSGRLLRGAVSRLPHP